MFLYQIFLWVFASASLPEVSDDKDIERPVGDRRKYHYMELENGLRVMMISTDTPDPLFYMDISVAIGSVHSPRRLQGLSHLLEHVIAAQLRGGGSVGGRTDELTTHFFITGSLETMFVRLREARDAVFEPVITDELIASCLDEVEAEFNCKAEMMRNQLVQLSYTTVLDPRHPVCHFRFGNRASLATVSIAELETLHRNFFSPHVTTMAVYASLPLAEIKRRVTRLYWKVPRRSEVLTLPVLAANLRDPAVAARLRGDSDRGPDATTTVNTQIPLLGPRILGHYVHAAPSSTGVEGGLEPEVIFEFYFESVRKVRMQTKPLRFLVEVLGHRGQGSLSWALKKKGLTNSVRATDDLSNAGVEILQIKMKLSSEAAAREARSPGSVVKSLSEYLFVYLNLFKKGIYAVDPRPLTNHVERKVKLRNQGAEPLQLVVDVAQGLRELSDYRQAVIGLALIRKATPQLIKSYWDRLHKENLAIRLIGEVFVRHCDLVEGYHCVPYGLSEIPWQVRLAINKAEQMKHGDLMAQAKMSGFSIAVLHTPYDLLVSDFHAKGQAGGVVATQQPAAAEGAGVPRKTMEPTLVQLTTGAVYLDSWASSGFSTRVEISFFSPWLQQGGLKNFAIAQVLRRCFAGILFPELYSATLRGFEHGMNVVENRFIWIFEGPAGGIAHLVEEYAKIIRTNEIPNDACARTLALSKETLGNRVRAMSAEDQAYHWLNMIIKSPFYSEWDMKDVVNALDYDRDIRPLTKSFWGTVAFGGVLKAGVTGTFDLSHPGALNPVQWVITIASELWARAEELAEAATASQTPPAGTSGPAAGPGGAGAKMHHQVAVQEDDFVDLRERQLRDFTLCRLSLSSRSRSGAVLVSVQLNGGDHFHTKQFDATLVVFQAIVNHLFTDFIGKRFRQVHLPYARGEVTSSSMRAQIHLLVTAGGEAQAIIKAVNDFLEELPSDVIEYDAIEEVKAQQAETAIKILDHPEQRKFYFFNEISRENPRFSWPLECRDFILAVSRSDLVEFAMQASSAPRIRVVIKHAQDDSVAETHFLPESFFRWKAARKGNAHRKRSLLSERKGSRSDSMTDT